jgi:hypothetical protein
VIRLRDGLVESDSVTGGAGREAPAAAAARS